MCKCLLCSKSEVYCCRLLIKWLVAAWSSSRFGSCEKEVYHSARSLIFVLRLTRIGAFERPGLRPFNPEILRNNPYVLDCQPPEPKRRPFTISGKVITRDDVCKEIWEHLRQKRPLDDDTMRIVDRTLEQRAQNRPLSNGRLLTPYHPHKWKMWRDHGWFIIKAEIFTLKCALVPIHPLGDVRIVPRRSECRKLWLSCLLSSTAVSQFSMGIDVYSEILNEVSQFGTGLLWWCESIEITLIVTIVFFQFLVRWDTLSKVA